MINKQNKATHIYGFDYLRCLGLILVLYQHQLATLDLEKYASLKIINAGQFGVAIFLSISGALALQSKRSPKDWMIARMSRIYPAFWIATALGFIAAGVSGYKNFDLYQIVSQFAGTGLLTHREQLVNVATWFVSLLLMLYLAVFIARCTRYQTLMLIVLVGWCMFFIFAHINPLIYAHAITFFLVAIFFEKQQERIHYLYFLTPALLVLSVFYEQFIYSSMVLPVTAIALKLPPPSQIVKLVSEYSYEFYLLHGIFIVGSYEMFGNNLLVSIPLGILSSTITAVLLKKVTLFLIKT